MNDVELSALIQEHGVKLTANRLIVARALDAAGRPLSMMEIESLVETIDKSGVFRVLQAFRDAHLVHVLEDSGEGVRYELCHCHSDMEDEDLHVHFFCEKCHRTFCLEDIPVPEVEVPQGYQPRQSSFIVKGICPDCAAD